MPSTLDKIMNTPRTDTAARHIDGMMGDWVPCYVSEELERELQEANDYADRLVEHKDMVCLPADLKNLREANAHFAAENEALKKQRDEAVNNYETAQLRSIRVGEQRDKWKASHDNQVELNRLLRDRPDLKERAALVDKLITQRDMIAAALEDCREDSIELLGERDWWQLENRCRYQERYQETQDNITRADAALQSLIKP
jgi:hypothetical protein